MMISPVKIVRLANYVAPASGGLRTALRELGAGYLAAGHEPVLVIPGPRPGRRLTEQGPPHDHGQYVSDRNQD